MRTQLFVFIIFLTSNAWAQLKSHKLNFSDMIYIQKNDIDKVNDYLISKGYNLKEMKEYGSISDYNNETKHWPGIGGKWSFKNSQGITLAQISYLEYTDFNFPENKDKDLPAGTSIFNVVKSAEQVKIVYTFYDEEIFISMKNRIEELKYDKGNNSIANNSLQTNYYSDKHIVRFSTMNQELKQQYFVIHLLYNHGNHL